MAAKKRRSVLRVGFTPSSFSHVDYDQTAQQSPVSASYIGATSWSTPKSPRCGGRSGRSIFRARAACLTLGSDGMDHIDEDSEELLRRAEKLFADELSDDERGDWN